MKIPKIYNGMKLIAVYPNHVVYEKEIIDRYGNKNTYRESFQKYDLGERTAQIKDLSYTRTFKESIYCKGDEDIWND